MIHIGIGVPGAQRAAELQAVAVIVDALRASASLCAMVGAGVKEIMVCPSVQAAMDLKANYPEALLAGEWQSEIPEGFDFDNSPLALSNADLKNSSVIFTSTNGARMLCAARGATEVYAGSVVNASQIEDVAQKHLAKGSDVVIVAAGDQDSECDEDMATAALLAESIGPDISREQEILVPAWLSRIADEGLEALFLNSKHGKELINRGNRDDVVICATPDVFSSLPRTVNYFNHNGATIARVAG